MYVYYHALLAFFADYRRLLAQSIMMSGTQYKITFYCSCISHDILYQLQGAPESAVAYPIMVLRALLPLCVSGALPVAARPGREVQR
jgi:hypothetical protein